MSLWKRTSCGCDLWIWIKMILPCFGPRIAISCHFVALFNLTSVWSHFGFNSLSDAKNCAKVQHQRNCFQLCEFSATLSPCSSISHLSDSICASAIKRNFELQCFLFSLFPWISIQFTFWSRIEILWWNVTVLLRSPQRPPPTPSFHSEKTLQAKCASYVPSENNMQSANIKLWMAHSAEKL